MKISKRVRLLAVIGGSGIVVASSACAVDSTAPTPVSSVVTTTPEARSGFAPSEASKALIGVADGTYTVTFNPAVDQVFSLGPNRLEMPANSVCQFGTSGYGAAYWNRACTPETKPVTLTVTVKNAGSDNPEVDFQPAMRFNPNTKVQLFFYVPRVSRDAARNWTILYCPNGGSGSGISGSCVNEALTDPSLKTYIDYGTSVLFRRVKHFSGFKVDAGYTVAE